MSIAWLLFTRAFKQNWRRLALTALAVCLGMTMLLVFTEMFNGLGGRSVHSAWRNEVIQARVKPQKPIVGITPLYITLSTNSVVQTKWRDKTIDIAAMAATDSSSPSLPDLPTPTPGQYYVSPALKEVMDAHPDDAIGVRYGTRLLGTIPDKYLESPDELAVIFGIPLTVAKDTMANTVPVYHLSNQAVAFSGYQNFIMEVLYLGIFILLFPVMLFISIATRLGSAQREQRYAALRLIGATKAQIRQIMLLESLIAASTGVVLGFLPFLALQPFAQSFEFQALRFWPSDMVVSTSQISIIVIAVLIFTVIANWWALRHVETSPLGVVQRVRIGRSPRMWRLLPLIAGLGLALLVLVRPKSDSNRVLELFGGVVLIMFGLVLAGPYVTRTASRFIAHVTRRAETLIGMKYIAEHPGTVFRSVAGVVVALFAGSFYLTATSGMENLSTRAVNDNGYSRLADNALLIETQSGESLPTGLGEQLQRSGLAQQLTRASQNENGVITLACSAAPRYIRVHCPSGERYVQVDFSQHADSPVSYTNSTAPASTPVLFATIQNSQLDKIRSFVAATGSDWFTNPIYVVSGAETRQPVINPLIKELASLAYIGIAVTMLVAIASLIVSTLSGLLERRRSLVTLRLGGMTVGSLKRVVIIESLVPLLTVTVISAALGIGVGFIMMAALTTTVHAVLSVSYLALFCACVAGAIVAIVCILPSVKRIADPEASQTE